mmetsp:Transcript_86111/g.200217  ORF Transcript_86111/g.200217 Transcript_86111/m.200217 type:complete len:229 (+) Transcript_86111:1448-2134(+)
MPRMPPVVDPLGAPQEGLSLCHLVVMVRETQVFAASVDVEELLVNVRGHYGALNVPPRAAGTPATLPSWFARFGLLPNREVVLVAFLGVLTCKSSLAFCHLSLTGVDSGHELPVSVTMFAEGVNAEVDTAVGFIGESQILQPFDERLHTAIHVRADPCSDVRPQHTQGVHVLKKLVLEMTGVGIKDGVIADRVAKLLVKLGHQWVSGCFNKSGLRLCQLHLHLQLTVL